MPQTLFSNCSLLDGAFPALREGFHVLVEGNRIREVSDRPIAVSGADEIDLRGRVLMPGLIDAHAHIFLSDVNIRRLEEVPLTLMAARSAGAMRGMLDRGFTTVRDAGGADWGIREAVERGYLAGPRLFIAGKALTQTGGHGDQRRRTESLEPCGCNSALSYSKTIADGVPEVRKAAREALRQGVNQIKVMVSGGVASPNDPIDSRQYSAEELRALVDETDAWNTYTMAHAYTARAIIHAVSCGIRTIEHGNLIDAEAADLMREKGAFMVPTLVTYDALSRHGSELGLPAVSLDKLKVVSEAGLQALELCHAAGVPLGFGTDLLGDLQSYQSLEFSIRAEVETPHQIITAATATNASILQMDGELGCIKAGALADLLVVDGNPLDDLTLLQEQGAHLSAIMKDGRFYKNQLMA